MTVSSIDSAAFNLESLRSQQLRIVALILVAWALLGISYVRSIALGLAEVSRVLPPFVMLVAILTVYELFVLWVARRAMHRAKVVHNVFWIFNACVEAAFTTVAILLVAQVESFSSHLSLVSPAILPYFFYIILSTLHLRPAMCVLTGGASMVGYFVAVVLVLAVSESPPEEGFGFGNGQYLTYGLTFQVGGIAAGAVAKRMHTHVIAALGEAEARHRAEQMERDLDIARSIQQGLLPATSPDVSGFDVAGWSQPADQTGGDYFDWQKLPDGRTIVSLADVTGHGIGPALVTASCRAYSRATFPFGRVLGKLLGHINDLLAEDLPQGRFVTFMVAVISPRSSSIEVLSAGHGPWFVYRSKEETVETHHAHGLPLAIAPEIEYDEPETVECVIDDVIVLVTDGFFEWKNAAGEQFGIERLSDCILRSAKCSAAEMIRRLYDDVVAFVGDVPQDDDLTAVVIKKC